MKIVQEHCLNQEAVWAERDQILITIPLMRFTLALAAFISWLDLFAGLIGSLAISSIGIMYLSIIDTSIKWRNLGWFNWKAIKNVIIFSFGFIGCLTEGVIKSSRIIEKKMFAYYPLDIKKGIGDLQIS